MGQIEIYQILKDRRESGDESFFKVCQIRRLLREKNKSYGNGTSLQVAQLESFGYLEVEIKRRKHSHWRSFRLKKEYLTTEQDKPVLNILAPSEVV